MSTGLLDKREERIRRMFDNIAPSYDLLNHLLSFNIDRYWRWRTTRMVPPTGTAPILDLCTGTGDLALAYDRAAHGQAPIIGADFSREMLTRAEAKVLKQKAADRIRFIEADAQSLPFSRQSFPDRHGRVRAAQRHPTPIAAWRRWCASPNPAARWPSWSFRSRATGSWADSIAATSAICCRSWAGDFAQQGHAYRYLPASVTQFEDARPWPNGSKSMASRTSAGIRSPSASSPFTWAPSREPRASADPSRTGRDCGASAGPGAMRQAGRWDPEFNRLRSGLSF